MRFLLIFFTDLFADLFTDLFADLFADLFTDQYADLFTDQFVDLFVDQSSVAAVFIARLQKGILGVKEVDRRPESEPSDFE